MSSKYADTFRDEVRELLSELEHGLLVLEEHPHDKAAVGRIFRTLHTIKGSGAMAGFDQVAEFTHEFESVIDLVRADRLQVTPALVSLGLAAKDHIRELVDATSDETPIDQATTDRLLAELRKVLESAGTPASPTEISEEPADDCDVPVTYRIRFVPEAHIFQKGINPLGMFRELERIGQCRCVAQVDDVPPLDKVEPTLCYLQWDIILTTSFGEDAIRDVFMFVEDDCLLDVSVIDDGGVLDSDADYKRLGEILVEHGQLDEEHLQQVLKQRKKLGESLVEAGLVSGDKIDAALAEQAQVQQQRQQRYQRDIASSIRVRSAKLDHLVDLVGELVTVQARLSRHAGQQTDPLLTEITEEVERLTWEMRDEIFNIRMVPIGASFSKFQRLVRDLSQELDKEVRLVTSGAETELDKTIIERLEEPLVHLLRNAIGHGIETPGERAAAGKSAEGTVAISAAQSGAYVVITVKDDGAGLNRDAIRHRAKSLGLLSEGAELADRDLLELICSAGLSTVGEVTNLSGRGVGMDAVRQAIEGLRGNLELHTLPGAGTTFTIRLPLTLAIIEGLLVRIGEVCYVFPMALVEECVELHADKSGRDRRRKMANVRGELVPYVRLREYFATAEPPPPIEQIVLAEVDGERIGFVVDSVIGEHQTVIKNLGQLYKGVRGISGATIMGDGRVALILDLQALSKGAEEKERLLAY
jgi:two-component system chemotaxis sensor kinase CheA